jgi:hypothetical protein
VQFQVVGSGENGWVVRGCGDPEFCGNFFYIKVSATQKQSRYINPPIEVVLDCWNKRIIIR